MEHINVIPPPQKKFFKRNKKIHKFQISKKIIPKFQKKIQIPKKKS